MPLPARVIGHLLGVPDEDSGRFKRIADSMIRGLDPAVFDQVKDEIDRDLAELVEVLDRTIEVVEGTGVLHPDRTAAGRGRTRATA